VVAEADLKVGTTNTKEERNLFRVFAFTCVVREIVLLVF